MITVLLNSDIEEEEDKQSLVEILFEMNYDTGERIYPFLSIELAHFVDHGVFLDLN